MLVTHLTRVRFSLVPVFLPKKMKFFLTSVLRVWRWKTKGYRRSWATPYSVEKSTGCETYEKNVVRKNFVFSNARTSYFYSKLFFFNANKHQLYKKMCIQKNLLALSQLANSAAFYYKIINYGYTTTNKTKIKTFFVKFRTPTPCRTWGVAADFINGRGASD